jgi:ubiquitin-conjugating enzyme E2 Z
MATPNTSGAIARITKEIAHIQRGNDLSLAVAYRESDVRHVRALIIGPPETPYEFGFFEFDIKFGKDYPIKSPNVKAITTNSSRCRFNPNIYNCGKVCLSILGTWRGEPGEEWSSAQGLESVLISIQSLMSSNPYENEPGYERAKKDEKEPKQYVAKIRHETMRISVIQRLEGLLGIEEQKTPSSNKTARGKTDDMFNKFKTSDSPKPSPANGHSNDTNGVSTPSTDISAYEYDAEAAYEALETAQWDPFIDLMKRRFLWYYDSYMKAIETSRNEQPEGKAFPRMPFEFGANSMEGHFDYRGLERRMKNILSALEEECNEWKRQGAQQVEQSTQMATQLAFQFKQLEYRWNETSYPGSRMEISLPDASNPFCWNLTFFGEPMTNLDGGIFNLTLSIPPNFPDIQPRVKFETPIFHHRVSSTGHLCYFPQKPDEIASHLEGIVKAVEDQNTTFDPRSVVNPDAFQLKWGGDDKKKQYNRKLRRSAQESCEY